MKKGKTLEQIKKQKERQRARMGFLYIVLALVLVLAGGYLLITRYFVINEINVSESSYYTPDEIIKTTGLKMGDSLFTCNDTAIEKKLYLLHPYISSVDVQKVFPTSIQITLEEQDGVMYVPVMRENYALSPELKVLGKISQPGGKTEIRTKGIDRCIVGELVSFTDRDDLELAKQLYSELCGVGAGEKTSYIDITERFNIMFNYDGRFDVYIGDEKLLNYKMRIFEKVIEDFPHDTGKITISERGRAVVHLSD